MNPNLTIGSDRSSTILLPAFMLVLLRCGRVLGAFLNTATPPFGQVSQVSPGSAWPLFSLVVLGMGHWLRPSLTRSCLLLLMLMQPKVVCCRALITFASAHPWIPTQHTHSAYLLPVYIAS